MPSAAPTFILDPKRTKSLDRAAAVIAYMQSHSGGPVSVQEVARESESFYEEVLHILTTLEVLGMVERYSRPGAPKEGPRVAYSWRAPTEDEAKKQRTEYKRKANLRKANLRKAS